MYTCMRTTTLFLPFSLSLTVTETLEDTDTNNMATLEPSSWVLAVCSWTHNPCSLLQYSTCSPMDPACSILDLTHRTCRITDPGPWYLYFYVMPGIRIDSHIPTN